MRALASELRQLLSTVHEIRQYDRDRLGYIESRIGTSGPVFCVGDGNLVVAEADTAKRILAKTNRTNHVDNGMYLDLDPIRMAETATDDWMPVRTSMQSLTHPKAVAAHCNRMVGQLARYLDSLVGTEIDLTQTLKTASGRVMADLITGPTHAAELAELVNRSVAANLPIMDNSRLWPKWAPLPSMRAHLEAKRDLARKLDDIVEDNNVLSNECESILSSMQRSTDLSAAEVRSAIQVSLLASFGVPGAAAAWSLLRIFSAPDLAARVFGELAKANEPLGLLSDCPTLQALIHETLRHTPPAWMVARLLVEPVEVLGKTYPIGTSVNVVIYSIHRDRRFWDKPELFDVQRWIDADRQSNQSYIPFGYGPRVCFGAQLGMLEIATILWVLLRKFEVRMTRMDDRPTVRALLEPRQLRGYLRRR